MLEDGTVDIDFFYREGEMLVHPMMDRLCFLLRPDGVNVHWLTDGAFDRSGLAPDNEFREPQNRRGPKQLPLKNGQWNLLRLQLLGDVVSLYLNGQEIYQRELESTNQRAFGLFHFADRTEARIRSIVYKGDWSRTLPTIDEQELADPEQRRIESQLADLPAKFTHDFSDGLTTNQITVYGTGWEKHVRTEPDGVHVTRPGRDDDGWYDFMLVPQVECRGDFDIIARFEDLVAEYESGGYGSAAIRLSFDDEMRTWCTWLLRTEQKKDGTQDRFLQLMFSQRREGKTFHEFIAPGSAENPAGRLRIARIGEQLHFMTSENDSQFFHLLASIPIGRTATLTGGINLLTSSHLKGETSVKWKDVLVRAERLTGTALHEELLTVAQLDEQRTNLEQLRDVPFSSSDAVNTLFFRSPSPDLFVTQDNGLKVVAPGSDNWQSSRLMAQLPIIGDFDAELDLEVMKMDQAATDSKSTVYLSAEFEGRNRPEVQCKYSIDPDGMQTIESQLRIPRVDRSYTYRELHTRLADRITGLRIARRGEIAYILFRRERDSAFEILGTIPVGTGPLHENGLQIHVHTGGKGLESQVLMKHLKIKFARQPAPELQLFPFLRGLFD